MKRLRFTGKLQIIDIGMTFVGGVLSVGTMLYAVMHFGLRDAWNELVLNLFYIACLVMMALYVFNRLDSHRFNYYSSLCIGVTVCLRDILFPPPLENYPIHLVCLVLSVCLLVLLTFFYARKDWKTYTKKNLWLLFVIDMILAGLYNLVIFLHPFNEYTAYIMTEIWIRPSIIYGLVACFVVEKPDTSPRTK